MQSQLVCSGCRNILLYPRGATNVRCAFCSAVTPVQPTGLEMNQLVCGGCRTLLMYTRGASSVRCLCCNTLNLTSLNLPPASTQVATITCGSCHITLMYPVGASSVKCAVCQYITNVGTANPRIPPVRPYGSSVTSSVGSTSEPMSHSQSQTVVVENPMSLDESGKLVSNVVVGVTTEKK
ncbi:histone demethylase SWIRM1 [Ancistrocladus abbreviatus]